jgi:hypothetical protein
MRFWIAETADLCTSDLPWLAISVALNIKDKNVWNSRSRSVAMCFGLTIIVPVLASITIRCIPLAKSLMIMPREEPGGAMYCTLFGSGCFMPREKGFNPGLNKCLRTNWSSCENAHSVSEMRSAPDVGVAAVAANEGGGGVAGDLLFGGGDGVAGLLND